MTTEQGPVPEKAQKSGSKKKTEIPKIHTYAEMDRVLLSITALDDLIAVRLWYYGGLRIEESCKLEARDVDYERVAVHIREGKGSKERWTPIDTGTATLIRCYVGYQDKVPGDRILQHGKVDAKDPRTWDKINAAMTRKYRDRFGKICEAAGIEEGRRHPHVCRHTAITMQLDRGVPIEQVSKNAGHSSIDITTIYEHLDIRARSQTYREALRHG